jgi:signal transduction histidine kinase
VTAWERADRLPLSAEIALAFATGAGTFALASVAFAGITTAVVAASVGVLYLLAVIAIARFASIAYAVPMGMAGMLAFDWFYLPPTHPLEFPDSANLVDLIVYLGVAVLLGELAAQAARRAEAAEHARGQIADEQAALRRVATLVARGAPAHELFAAVAAEAGILLDVHGIRIARYQDETELVHVSEWSKPGYDPPRYDHARLEGTSVSAEVLRTGRSARIDNYEDIAVRAPFARGIEAKSVVGAPVVLEDRLWGVMIAWSGSGPLPSETERRLTDFAELVATAISNTHARTEMARLATRLLTAGDDARRRVERDLHDGAQQSLVQAIITLKLVEHAVEEGDEAAKALVGEALDQAERANAELRELAHGILPAALAYGGLSAGVRGLVSRLRVPVSVDVPRDRFPPEIEASAYLIVAEALTNVAKHAGAQSANVTARADDSVLHVHVRDDGVGGARADGTGLLGLNDRVTALGGQLEIESPPGGGTRIAATLPLQR